MSLSPAQTSYVIDFVLGFVLAGIVAASGQLTAQGALDWKSLAIAFLGGAVAFGRQYLHSNIGVSAVGNVPSLPPPRPPLVAPLPPAPAFTPEAQISAPAPVVGGTLPPVA